MKGTNVSSIVHDHYDLSVDAIVEKFERAWHNQAISPNISDYVDVAINEKTRELLLQELVLIDIEFRTKRGLGFQLKDYCDRYPELSNWTPTELNSRDTSVLISDSHRKSTLPPDLGRYQILNPIGQGGMGIVYEARDSLLNRVVAIKLVRSDSMENRRFQNEAEIVSRLDHPNIVPVYDFGVHDGKFFLAMKRVEGASLDHWPTRYPCEPNNPPAVISKQRMAAAIVRDVARGIQHAHHRGVLHRDLKPSNILLDQQENPFIVDFGLAKHLENDLEMTQSGMLIGTPCYMAPEMIAGQRSKSSARNTATTAVDIYGLGAIFHYLLTGKPPYRGETLLETLKLVDQHELPSIRMTDRSLSRDLEAICFRCLEKQPDRRYRSADDVADELDRWLHGLPIQARKRVWPEQALRWCMKHRAIAALLVTFTASITIAIVSLAVGLRTATVARDDAIHQRQVALTNLKSVIDEIDELENLRPDLDEMRLGLLTRIQKHLEPMLLDPVHGSAANETNFWLETKAGDIEEWRGDLKSAQLHFQRAMNIANRISSDSDVSQQRLYSFALSHMGDYEWTRNEPRNALQYFNHCLKIRQELCNSNPSYQARIDLALAHIKSGESNRRISDQSHDKSWLRPAVDQIELGLELLKPLAIENPKDIWNGRFLAYAWDQKASSHLGLEEWDLAISSCKSGIACMREAKARLPDYRAILEMQEGHLSEELSICCWYCGQFEEGERFARTALDIQESISKFSPNATLIHVRIMRALDILGQHEHCLGKIEDAHATLMKGIQLSDEFIARPMPCVDAVLLKSWMIDHLIVATSPHRSFDERTFVVVEKRIAMMMQAYERFQIESESSRQRSDIPFDLSVLELLLLAGKRERAKEVLEFIEPRTAWVANGRGDDFSEWLQEIRLLIDQIFTEALNDGEVRMSLLQSTRSAATLMRLQTEFRDTQELAGLATASVRLAKLGGYYYMYWYAARGMAEALQQQEDGPETRELKDRLLATLVKLQSFGEQSVKRIKDDPVLGKYLDGS